MCSILLKRVYEAPAKADGFRILVDRLWPRGVTREAVAADVWMKDIGPSSALRKWFDHDPAKWNTFSKKYRDEIKDSEPMRILINYCKIHPTITLLYTARDEKHNQAITLQQFLYSLQQK